MRGFDTRFRALAVAAALTFGAVQAQAQDAATDAAAPAAVTAGQAAAVPADAAPAADAAAAPAVNLANMGTAPDPAVGQPLGGWQIQPQVTELGQRGSDFNTALLLIMGVITVFVFALLIWSIIRYRRGANPVPSKTTHNVLVEVVWTLMPVLVLVGIAIPSFKLLAAQYDPPKADLTIKATGHQWYWSYEYPDQGGFGFDSVILSNEEAEKAGEPKLLAVDNRIVVPAGAVVKVLVTASDVIHSWAVPAFWVKMDAVPGRINETWFKTDREGLYYGQCSELCGTKHGFMPIAVEVVSKDKFDAWVAARQADAGIEVAAAAPAADAAAAPEAAPAAATTL
ncbi:cytochrome c oxidase subunit II [Sphingosinicella microcystinivorans]|uniref:cytochrome c oxidase subunit II n=1 Tax=Sphingosinicella microcystinivorans TaxID=335406 RepID=UPI0022F3DB6E|nr:cytochrome c oxidase subunit II [Sphingosinicella microcystinivorans]WBX85238.1 cytochrome c oxidase subunit II [Sphingosinicella microcystinivorans]